MSARTRNYERLAGTVGARGRPLNVVVAALRDYDRDRTRTTPQIAAGHGLPERTLQNWARRAGLDARPSRPLSSVVPLDELHRTVDLVHELGSPTAAGRALGICQTGVTRRLRRADDSGRRGAAA